MDAARIKRARWRLRGNFFGSGVIMAALYLIFAAFLVQIFGLELTRYWSTLMLAAGVMLGGTYAIVMFLWLGVRLLARLKNGQPLIEVED